ncbi:hypothetical protein AB832_07440 [Flavobacteriaceae bacterium (ex Bugula neritina AB1)]|nr:hypothetical protein AB832_07440 [Flavobacteriaceae bacterium (ex Bugula neritina AB1)]
MRDVVEGQQAIKDGQEKYLPIPDPTDKTQENKERYQQYLQRALFYNVTGRTKAGLVGNAFVKDPILDAENLDYIKSNADGNGTGLDQMAHKCIGEMLEVGRGGLLTDYPATDGTQSKADNFEATLHYYTSEQVINWDTAIVNGKKKLSLVVLDEPKETVNPDTFEKESHQYWRVLTLEGGIYHSRMYEKAEDKGFTIVSESTPTDGKGVNWKEIPFTFVGSENNDEQFDAIPLKDLAFINISHYQNSADVEESAFIVGQPTPVFSEIDEHWAKEFLQGKTLLGSRSGVVLPVGGTASLLQANSNMLPRELMKDKEEQMIKVGARLIESPSNATATAILSADRASYSVLGMCCINVSEAITQCLKWAARYMSTSENVSYKINTEFVTDTMTPQELQAIIQLWQSGTMAWTDAINLLKKKGYIDSERTLEQISEDIEGSHVTLE